MAVSGSKDLSAAGVTRPPGAVLSRPVELVGVALLMVTATYLLASYFNHLWLVGADGNGIPDDFVNVWAAGRMVLEGHSPAVYDWPAHKAMEETALGRAFEGYFGWHYPPNFLFVAAALALLPYIPAYLLWLAVTFPIYLLTIRAIIGERSGYLLAAAFPGVLFNAIVGQNGFLSAGLMGAGLVLLAERPVLAGLAFGVLTYKPQLGILIPIALIAGGYWRTIAAAGAVTLAWSALSLAAFGLPTWQGFIANIRHTEKDLPAPVPGGLFHLQTSEADGCVPGAAVSGAAGDGAVVPATSVGGRPRRRAAASFAWQAVRLDRPVAPLADAASALVTAPRPGSCARFRRSRISDGTD